MKRKFLTLASCSVAALILTSCESTDSTREPQELHVTAPANTTHAPLTIRSASGPLGRIERLTPEMDELLPKDAIIEKLAEGFDWSEGPVWMPGDYLLFSDVPMNTVFRWDKRRGISVFLQPSGYTGSQPRGGEPGSNGLTHDKQGRLILCQHGDRRVARLEDGKFITMADRYDGKRFNSPNDVVVKSNGDFYFTDPPYGLVGNMKDPAKEIPFQGVYRVAKDGGKVTLLTDEVTRPNGLAFSPDEKTLYVASSDPQKAIWMAYPVKTDGTLEKGRVLFDATEMAKSRRGLPDGLKVDRRGNLWATGPGGVLVLSPEGKLLGVLNTGEATANCGWGDDGSTLYITADMYLCRVRTKTKGAGR
jgi:gluconolactonase